MRLVDKVVIDMYGNERDKVKPMETLPTLVDGEQCLHLQTLA